MKRNKNAYECSILDKLWDAGLYAGDKPTKLFNNPKYKEYGMKLEDLREKMEKETNIEAVGKYLKEYICLSDELGGMENKEAFKRGFVLGAGVIMEVFEEGL